MARKDLEDKLKFAASISAARQRDVERLWPKIEQAVTMAGADVEKARKLRKNLFDEFDAATKNRNEADAKVSEYLEALSKL